MAAAISILFFFAVIALAGLISRMETSETAALTSEDFAELSDDQQRDLIERWR